MWFTNYNLRGKKRNMDVFKLCDSEYKFINVIWDAEPVNSTNLVKLCADKLGWKKSTTYTMLRRLAEQGFVKNENATVTALVKREQIQRYEAEAFMGKVFNGSIPSFLVSFLHDKTLTETEANEIQRLIKEATKNG